MENFAMLKTIAVLASLLTKKRGAPYRSASANDEQVAAADVSVEGEGSGSGGLTGSGEGAVESGAASAAAVNYGEAALYNHERIVGRVRRR